MHMHTHATHIHSQIHMGMQRHLFGMHTHRHKPIHMHSGTHTKTYRQTCRAHDGVLFAHTRWLKSPANLSVVKATAHSALCCCSNVNSHNPSFRNRTGGVRSSHNSSCQPHPDSHTLKIPPLPPTPMWAGHLEFSTECNQRDRTPFLGLVSG